MDTQAASSNLPYRQPHRADEQAVDPLADGSMYPSTARCSHSTSPSSYWILERPWLSSKSVTCPEYQLRSAGQNMQIRLPTPGCPGKPAPGQDPARCVCTCNEAIVCSTGMGGMRIRCLVPDMTTCVRGFALLFNPVL